MALFYTNKPGFSVGERPNNVCSRQLLISMKRLFVLFVFAFSLSFTANAQNGEVEIIIAKKIKVFPNPATNVVNVLGLKNSLRAEIVISDSYGNTVLQHRWAIKNNALNIPIINLNSGIYIITVRSQEQQVQTKFYKQ